MTPLEEREGPLWARSGPSSQNPKNGRFLNESRHLDWSEADPICTVESGLPQLIESQTCS